MRLIKAVVLTGRKIRGAVNNVRNKISFGLYHVQLKGKPLEMNGVITVRKSTAGSIVIGERFKINSGKNYNIIAPECTRSVLRTIGQGKIEIGDDVGISNTAIIAENLVKIGSHVMIGGGCRIWDTDFHPVSYEERSADYEASGVSKPIVIEDGAFIGAGVTILKGVTIGEKAIIGACSVVTHDVPAGEMWAGNPAKKIR